MGLKRNNSKSVGLLARMIQICGAPTGGEITEKNTSTYDPTPKGGLGTGEPSIPGLLPFIDHPRFFCLSSPSSGSFGMVIPPFDNNHKGYVFWYLVIRGASPPNNDMVKCRSSDHTYCNCFCSIDWFALNPQIIHINWIVRLLLFNYFGATQW